MSTYICDSHRPAQAESLKDAAKIFAFRKARIEFGRSAKVGGLTQLGGNEMIGGEFEAFIGHGRSYSIEGHAVRFPVYRVTYEK